MIAVIHYPELLFFEGLKTLNEDIKKLIEKYGILQNIDNNFFNSMKESTNSQSIDDVKNLYEGYAYCKNVREPGTASLF